MARPLTGKRVLLTRRRSQSAEMTERLQAMGAEVIEVPAIEIAVPEDTRELDAALRSLASYAWVVFTSPNGVEQTRARMDAIGIDVEALRSPRIAVVGPTTGRSLARHFDGRAADLMPESDFRGEGLAKAFEATRPSGQRILLLVADKASVLLPTTLRRQGADVVEVVAYRTIAPASLETEVPRLLAGGLDLALFASPSAIEHLAAAAGPLVHGLPCAVIGPSTEAAARQWGLDVRAVANPSTSEGLLVAAESVLAGAPRGTSRRARS